ncbi:MAG: hypothetical protein HQ515_15005 [Phycisphaeraceae bacterium]|nr:hypothetical protein [Phycisphaeraceae bacterium]
MSEQHDNGPDLVDVTDSLEAVSVFRTWKNLFLFILTVCMLLIQGIFWVTDLGLLAQEQADPNSAQAARTVAADPNATSLPVTNTADMLSGITSVHLDRALSLINSIAFLVAVLLCLTLMFSMMITIVSRLGGIRHISRAFFLSMIVLVFLVPWHAILDFSVFGVLFELEDLVQSMTAKQDNLYATSLYYARFCGYWIVTLLMIFILQARLGRWARAMRRRLEII